MSPHSGTTSISIQRALNTEPIQKCIDTLAVEEPLEIRLGYSNSAGERLRQTISITMRTPGADFELALGFLYTEGLIQHPEQINDIQSCGNQSNQSAKNVVRVELHPKVTVDLKRLERHFYTNSSCGVCGKTSIDALHIQSPLKFENTESLLNSKVTREVLYSLPEKIRNAQSLFHSTGGLHASALFSLQGKLEILREDVGRHNALDKLMGWAFANKRLPLYDSILMVSGRSSFELVQKASLGGIRIMAAIGAPSSLAVELAQKTQMTLIGFLKNDRFNIYHGTL